MRVKHLDILLTKKEKCIIAKITVMRRKALRPKWKSVKTQTKKSTSCAQLLAGEGLDKQRYRSETGQSPALRSRRLAFHEV